MNDDQTPGSNDDLGDDERRPSGQSRRQRPRGSDSSASTTSRGNTTDRDAIGRQLDQPSNEVLREPASRPQLRSDPAQRPTVSDLLRRIDQSDTTSTSSGSAESVGEAAQSVPPTEPAATPSPTPSAPTPKAPTPSAPTPKAPTPTPPPTSPAETPAGSKPASTSDRPTTAASQSAPQWIDQTTHSAPAKLPASSSRIAAAQRSAARLHSAKTAGRVVVIMACVLALVGTGGVWGYLKIVNGGYRSVSAVDGDDKNIRNKGAQTGDQNYLIVGTDSRAGANGKVGAGTTAEAGGARSDTVILVNVPASRSRVVAVSFPRDLQIDRPECTGWDNDAGKYTDNTIPAEGNAKLNSAYGDGGPKCAVKAIQQLSGLNINHFIAMDFSGFEKVVNKIGGVEVCSPTPLYDYELGQVLSKSGKQVVRGGKALNYVRARTIESEGNGDYGRIKRQQLFLSSMLRGILSGKVLSNPVKLNGVISTFIKNSFVDNVNTDDLLNLAQSLEGLQAGRVTFLTTPTSGTSTDGSNNEIPRSDDIDAIFDAIINDDSLPGEQNTPTKQSSKSKSKSTAPKSSAPSTSAEPPSSITATAQQPSAVGVRVLNATGTVGLAGDVSDKLSADSFDVRGIADASQQQDKTVVRYGPGQENAAATVAAMFPGASIQPDVTVKSGVEVLLGSDYQKDLRSAPTAGSQLTTTKNPASAMQVPLPNDLSVTNGADTSCNS